MSARLLKVEIPQYVECLLLHAVFADEALAVPAILDVRQRPARTAEVHEYPRRGAAPLRNASEHGERLRVQILLELFRETVRALAVHVLQRVRAEFADDHGFVVTESPADVLKLVRQAVIPADVLVEREQVG